MVVIMGSVIRSFRNQGSADLFAGDDTKAARVPGNELHPLKKDRLGQHAMRINDTYRICFVWTDEGPTDVEVTDYH